MKKIMLGMVLVSLVTGSSFAEQSIESSIGLDIAIQDASTSYNQSLNELNYNMKIKNIGTVDYDIGGMGTIPQVYVVLNPILNSNNPVQFLSVAQYQNSQDINFMINPLDANGKALSNGTHTICNTFKVGVLNLMNSINIFPQDVNVNNNTKEICATFTKTSANTQPSTGSTISPSTSDKEDLTITNVSAKGAYPKSTLTITLANLGKSDYDIGSKDPTVTLFCYQKGFKKFGVSKPITEFIGSSVQSSISTTLNLKLRGSKKSAKNIICTIDSENKLDESDEGNNTYTFKI